MPSPARPLGQAKVPILVMFSVLELVPPLARASFHAAAIAVGVATTWLW